MLNTLDEESTRAFGLASYGSSTWSVKKISTCMKQHRPHGYQQEHSSNDVFQLGVPFLGHSGTLIHINQAQAKTFAWLTGANHSRYMEYRQFETLFLGILGPLGPPVAILRPPWHPKG